MPHSGVAELMLSLEPDIAEALENWVITMMKERTGPGMDGQFVTKNGLRVYDVSFKISDVFTAINDAAPDAIARMLQAGAAKFIRTDTPLEQAVQE